VFRYCIFYYFALCLNNLSKLYEKIFAFAVKIMYDKNSGRSRGFGFVHFSNDHEAKCAKDAMDGKV
jgi:RNA recognition motif-containing protein